MRDEEGRGGRRRNRGQRMKDKENGGQRTRDEEDGGGRQKRDEEDRVDAETDMEENGEEKEIKQTLRRVKKII